MKQLVAALNGTLAIQNESRFLRTMAFIVRPFARLWKLAESHELSPWLFIAMSLVGYMVQAMGVHAAVSNADLEANVSNLATPDRTCRSPVHSLQGQAHCRRLQHLRCRHVHIQHHLARLLLHLCVALLFFGLRFQPCLQLFCQLGSFFNCFVHLCYGYVCPASIDVPVTQVSQGLEVVAQ